MSSAEAEIAKLAQTFDMSLTTDFGQIEAVIQQKIDQNRGKVRVAADLSEKGIAEINAEERMQSCSQNRPFTTSKSSSVQVAGDHTDRATQRTLVPQRNKPSRNKPTRVESTKGILQRERTASRRSIRGLCRRPRPCRPRDLAVGDGPAARGGIFSSDELKQLAGGGENPDNSGITTVKDTTSSRPPSSPG